MATNTRLLDTAALAAKYRSAVVDRDSQRLLITKFTGTEQEHDLSEPPNCRGVGRIRHFKRHAEGSWVDNPLPIDPACKALALPRCDEFRAQVFQLAACNWRCWYCFVPFPLLSASERHSEWLTAEDLLQRYLGEPQRPPMIDLSGGEPSLAPEWVPWMIRAVRAHGLTESIYLWSDDNLSCSYFWDYLTDADIATVVEYRHYSRVCCFKGFDSASFSFNTNADPSLFARQFELFERYFAAGMDLYAYVTLSAPPQSDYVTEVPRFLDRLQSIHVNLPLRTVPLEVRVFSPVRRRLKPDRVVSLTGQERTIDTWKRELQRRFSATALAENIAEVHFSSDASD